MITAGLGRLINTQSQSEQPNSNQLPTDRRIIRSTYHCVRAPGLAIKFSERSVIIGAPVNMHVLHKITLSSERLSM